MGLFNRGVVVPVLRFSGAIGMAAPLRPGLSIATFAGPIEKAFSLSRAPSVAVVINSPGGSPVQASLLFRRLRQLADEKKKKIYVFCEDVAASGGYYLAVAGDEIYADASSIVGSIGVISASFGLDRAIEKLGISRRVYTAGTNKGALDPFQPERAEDIERLKAIQRTVHDVFIGVVKDRRLGRLKGPDAELFSGAFWSAPEALELGLIDGISDVRTKMREIHGPNVRLRVVAAERGLLSRMRKLPSVLGGGLGADGPHQGLALADDLVSAVEIRALWSRFGL
jgi:signal peptide peptidase SppA